MRSRDSGPTSPIDLAVVETGDPAAVADPGGERPLVSTDRPVGPDELGRAEDAAFLAEVVLHRRLETPFTLGLFGAAGSGKTFFLNQILDATGRLAGGASPEGPFETDVVVTRLDASRPGEPGVMLAEAVLDGLAETHPALAADLAHAGADPAEAAQQANAALDDLRRRHQAERETLDGFGSREARLVESLLAPGSAVDIYARGHRSAIERALRQFGFPASDGMATYKDLVREAAESPGLPARVGLGVRALWAYRGQTRLLVLAALFALIAWFLSALDSNGDGWIASLRQAGDKAGPVAEWAQAHVHGLGTVQTAAGLLCLLSLATAAWRAMRFLRPIFKGTGLLQREVAVRSRDVQGLLAHQTRRVDGLAAEVAAAAKHAGEADRRAGHRVAGQPDKPRASRRSQAGAVFAALAAAMDRSGPGDGAMTAAPRRIVIALDNLDDRSGEAAAALIDAARQLPGPGVVCIAAANRTHVVDGFGDADPARALARFERCIQIGYRLDAGALGGPAFATRLIGTRTPLLRPPAAQAAPDPKRSSLDRPWRLREAETLAALSGFAGETPRAIKRYVNLYRIARADPKLRDAPAPVFTALALALALDAHGYPEDLAALAKASQGEAAGESSVLRQALAVAREAAGEPVELGQAQRGIEVAARYAARG